MDSTGPTGPTQLDLTGPTGPTEPTTISLSDLMNATEVLKRKEYEDRVVLEGIWSVSLITLQGRLLQWALSGFPNASTIMELNVQPPTICSDGVVRGLADYIQYCSEKTIQEHIALLQAKLPDIVVAYAYTGASILIVVSKA